MRNRYGIEIKVYPDEVFIRPSEVWKNITKVRLIRTIWARKGMRYEDFMNSVSKDAEGGFKLQEVKSQLDRQEHRNVSFSQFDIQILQMISQVIES
jgi:hypothetical protein